MPRITITVSDEANSFIREYAQDHGLSVAKATNALIIAGAQSIADVQIALPAPHGDVSRINRMAEYKQCPQCAGWNVGTYEDQRVCADCGWHEAED